MKILVSALAALVIGATAIAFAQNLQVRPQVTLPAPETNVPWEQQKGKESPVPEFREPEAQTLTCELQFDMFEQKQLANVDANCADRPGRVGDLMGDGAPQNSGGGDQVADTPRVQGPTFTAPVRANAPLGDRIRPPDAADASNTKAGSTVHDPAPMEQRTFTPRDFRISPPSDTDDENEDEDGGDNPQ
jgi:hypothetical protein